MKWNRYTIKTTTEAVDLISCMLAELGIEGIEIQDNVQLTQEEAKTMFVDFIPELPPDDGTAKVNFYIDADEDDNTILGKVEEGLEELRTFVNVGDATVTESQTEDKDWINNWKQYWHTFTIGDLYIKPTWEPVTDEMKGHQVLSIDPGTAFGTGSHETTRMVILQLQKYIKGGEEVLDVGCGKGICMKCAVESGYGKVAGLDLDKHLLGIAKKNMSILKMDVRLINANAVDFDGYADFDVFYFYNPFGRSVFEQVIEKIKESQKTRNRDIWIAYYHPVFSELFDKAGFELKNEVKDKTRDTTTKFYYMPKLK